MVIAHTWIRGIIACLSVGALVASARAAKFVDVRTVDDEHLQVHWLDGEVEYKDTGTGRSAFLGGTWSAEDVVHRYEPDLDTAAAVRLDSYTVSSTDDANYAKPAQPVAAYRKSKVNGTNNKEPATDYTLEHTVYLKMPRKLKQGGHYTLTMAAATKTDTASQAFTFDIYASVSEAIRVNLIGYNPDHTVVKAADLYMWMGDGGGRDYSSYAGNKVLLHNVETAKNQEVGTVKFWKKSGNDFGGWNATQADVWNCDFSSFTGTGTYRLAVEGVGCSPDFKLSRDIYYEPFKTSVRGFYYMRIGEDKQWALDQHLPVPRQPQYIPGKDPADFKVYLTTCGPWHPDWKKGGDWDRHDWSKYNEPGEPTNPNAWGGHADATDWDRNPGHISIIWDLLLPYFLSNGKIRDDNLQIPESGNGIPDIIDEACNEVDFWLRVRDTKGGYSAGLNNPGIRGKEGGYQAAPVGKDAVIYQAAASPYMARESLVTAPTSEIDIDHKCCQLWGTAAYLMCAKNKWQPIHYAKLLENMSAAMLHEAMQKNVSSTEKWLSRLEGLAARRGPVGGAVLLLHQRVHAAAVDAREDVSFGIFVFTG
jgi:endoglucanase